MSDTPRTDDEEMSPRLDVECMIVSADFARQLERELAEARKQRDTLAEALEDYELDYTDGELARLATCATGLGEISPADAEREIRRRQALAAVKP
jgi:hypothetical protein